MARDSQQAMACPIDGTALVMSERQGIEIDYCPACRGVWLDRGELDKILERSAGDLAPAGRAAAAPAPPPAPWGDSPRRYEDDHRHHGHRKRRKSFLEELFD
jgi:hypothetical protein